MEKMIRCYLTIILFVVSALSAFAQSQLRDLGRTTQLFVNGVPRLMIGVEVTNKLLDRPEDLQYLDENLDMYKEAGVNTVLVPITWYSLEPEQDQYDYTMIDALIEASRKRNLMLIPLWFGSIKNGGLSYAPDWFKEDRDRFFRVVRPDGSSPGAISPFSVAAMKADREAFRHLMRRIKQKDPGGEVVVMVQPENETGVVTMNDQRDMSTPAKEAWNNPVPDRLMDYLKSHDGELRPWLQGIWEEHGKRTSGTWPEVFGADDPGEKIFMSYHMARYVGQIAKAGQQVYDLPMYVNDWLGGLKKPNGPIGGPDFQVHDVWRAAAPGVFDVFAPDIYRNNFKDWCRAYHRPDNPLLIPEAVGTRGRSSAQAWYAFIQHDALLYAPYLHIGDEYHPDPAKTDDFFKRNHFEKSYPLIADMKDLILERQGRQPREMVAFLMDKGEPVDTVYQDVLPGLTISATPRIAFPDKEREAEMVTPFAAVFSLGRNEFAIVGTKMSLRFSRQGETIKAADAQFGRFVDSQWVGYNEVEIHNEDGAIEYQLPKDDTKIQQVRFRVEAE